MLRSLIIFAGSYLFIANILAAGILWWTLNKDERTKLAARFVIASMMAVILAKAGGALFYDPRPFVVHHFVPLIPHAADNGFPSDHTELTMLLALLCYPYSKWAGLALGVISIAVGSARIAAGIHSLPDITGSIVFAVLSVILGVIVAPKLTCTSCMNIPSGK